MSEWSWLKLTVFLWLIRKAVRLARWLLLAVAAGVAWPVTVVTAAGYLAARLRGWPPARLYRAAVWSLPATVAWLAALEVRMPGWLAARTPGRAWDHLDTAALARAFVLLAPVTVPAGLALAGLVWAWLLERDAAGQRQRRGRGPGRERERARLQAPAPTGPVLEGALGDQDPHVHRLAGLGVHRGEAS